MRELRQCFQKIYDPPHPREGLWRNGLPTIFISCLWNLWFINPCLTKKKGVEADISCGGGIPVNSPASPPFFLFHLSFSLPALPPKSGPSITNDSQTGSRAHMWEWSNFPSFALSLSPLCHCLSLKFSCFEKQWDTLQRISIAWKIGARSNFCCIRWTDLNIQQRDVLILATQIMSQ